ncbi:MAG: hypothetical protein KJ052_18245 [Candidatus Hydrogenedentes bacterium]|nr:hypothetical protein [Candidatus Hydrogenedentota bacterium]
MNRRMAWMSIGLASLIVAAAVTGCPPAQGPTLVVTPGSLDFSTSYIERVARVMNAGAGNLNWTATSNKPWLKVEPLNAANESLLHFIIDDRTDLTQGINTAEVSVKSGEMEVKIAINAVRANGLTQHFEDPAEPAGSYWPFQIGNTWSWAADVTAKARRAASFTIVSKPTVNGFSVWQVIETATEGGSTDTFTRYYVKVNNQWFRTDDFDTLSELPNTANMESLLPAADHLFAEGPLPGLVPIGEFNLGLTDFPAALRDAQEALAEGMLDGNDLEIEDVYVRGVGPIVYHGLPLENASVGGVLY